MVDQYFTPDWAADILASVLPKNLTGLIVDPAAGEGALLAAVQRHTGNGAKYAAIDADPRVTGHLRSERPDWLVSNSNFLKRRSRESGNVWKEVRKFGVDAVVMNPPFSYRGGPSTYSEFGAHKGHISPAANFVAESLKHLNPKIGLYCILPEGSISGDKHRNFWSEVERDFVVDVIQELDTTSFKGARVRTKILAITRGGRIKSDNSEQVAEIRPIPSYFCSCLDLLRGRVPMYRIPKSGDALTDLIHTTDIKSDRVTKPVHRAFAEQASLGPMVVLPRVGRPIGKIAISHEIMSVLSDCVLGLRPLQSSSVERLATSLRRDRSALDACYLGTGARYITVSTLAQYLTTKRWNVRMVPASAASPPCSCSHARFTPAPSPRGALFPSEPLESTTANFAERSEPPRLVEARANTRIFAP